MRVAGQSRRAFSAMLGMSLAAPLVARADPIHRAIASRIESADGTYVPPTNLGTIADLFRRMTAPVSVAEQGPFRFVVDTGANQSVISEELATQLRLPRGQPEALHGVAGVETTGVVTVDLRIGRRVEKDVTLSVLPQAAIGGAGMLGVDRLAGQLLVLDFQERQLRIENSRRQSPAWDEVSLQARERDGQLTLVESYLGQTPVLAFLDSGAQSSIGNLALRRLVDTGSTPNPWATVPILSATGQTIEGERAILPLFRVGHLKLENLAVVFSDLHIFKLWNMTGQPAILLGMDVLSQFASVSLDFGRNEVRLRIPNAD